MKSKKEESKDKCGRKSDVPNKLEELNITAVGAPDRGVF